VPHILFAEELIAAYPEAKVVLTIRDPDSWWRSYSNTAIPSQKGPIGLNQWLEPRAAAELRAFWRFVWGIMLGTPFPTPEAAKARFVAYYEDVRRMVPEERLLEYRVGEGWDRLCKFLGKSVPAEPFPRVNDTQAYLEQIKRRNIAILRQAAFKYFTPAIVVAAGMIAHMGCGRIRSLLKIFA
jgi:hypothetical protein